MLVCSKLRETINIERMRLPKPRLTHVFILFLWIFIHSVSDGFGQCDNNTIAFAGSTPIHNAACGNSGYQQVAGSVATGTNITYGWEVSYDGQPFVTLNPGSPVTSQTLPKDDITTFISLQSPKSATYRIRRVVYSSSVRCSSCRFCDTAARGSG